MKLKSLITFLLCSFLGQTQMVAQKPLLDSLSKYRPPSVQGLDTSYIAKYPMVDFDKNYFQFFSEKSPAWDVLFEKMENMVLKRKAKLNFYHIGGSHLQADIYTHDIRTSMQTSWRKLPGERGWVFPFDLAKTNNPWNYEFKSPNTWQSFRSVSSSSKSEDFGVLGAKITCPDSVVNITFKYDKTEVAPSFSKVRIFHNKGNFPFELNWDTDEILWWKQKTDTVAGYTEVVFMELLESFDLQFSRTTSDPYEMEIYGFQLLNDYPGVSYTSIGINGAGLYTYLGCNRFEEQLKTYPPDLFIFSVGTNDGNVPNDQFDPQVYKRNLENMMKIVLRANPNCAILLTVPNDSYYHRRYLNENIAKERTVIQELAAQYRMPVWDFYGIMGELGSSKTWYNKDLMRNDFVHFTSAGYHLKGELFFDAFRKYIHQFGQRKLVMLKNGIDGRY